MIYIFQSGLKNINIHYRRDILLNGKNKASSKKGKA